MNNQRKIAVISTGNGGQAMAAYFANMGFHVSRNVLICSKTIFSLWMVSCSVR